MVLNGSDIMMEVLLEEGVDLIFGYPGGSVLNIYDALYKYQDKIKNVLTADEECAAHAADGYARSTGKTGVVLATSGPGATNLVTALATAHLDSVPLVAFTGNVPTPLIGKDSFQEVFITGITMPITKHNFLVRDVADLAGIIRDAFEIAQSGRKGVVLIDIPKDITAATTEYTKHTKHTKSWHIVADDSEIQEAAKIINEAKRPVVYYGGGSNSFENSVAVRDFIEHTSMFSTNTIMACGVVEDDNEHHLGMIGMHGTYTANYALSEADVVLAIGTRFSDRVALNTSKFAHKAEIIHIEIDPSEIHKNVDVEHSLVGDLKDTLASLLKYVKPITERDNEAWIKDIWQAREKEYKPSDEGQFLKPHKILEMVQNKVAEDSVFVTDVGQHQMWSAQFIKHKNPRSFITSGGLGTMGFGYGAAIGAKFGNPDKTVVHVTGDGSFGMNINHVITAVNNKLPVITIIMNNQTLGMVRQWQTSFYDKRYSSTDIVNGTDYVKVAEGFHAKGFRCETLEQLADALDKALTYDVPTWIECIVDKDERVLPMIPPGGSFDDIILE